MRRLLLLLGLVIFLTAAAFPCSCVPPPPPNGVHMSLRDLAARRSERADLIFEGVPDRVRVVWSHDKDKPGDLVPASFDLPQREYTFKVARTYKGAHADQAKITTGFGMGDCGELFRADVTYVIYADREDDGSFSTSICSGDFEVKADDVALRYLRGEPALPSDLQPPSPDEKWTPPTNTSKVCGSVIGGGRKSDDNVNLFLSRQDKLGLTVEDGTDLEDDGTFCFDSVDPGTYVLATIITSENSATALTYYPGVATAAEATPIDVHAGDQISKLVVAFPKPSSTEVTGRVVPQNAALPTEGVAVMLIGNTDFPMMPGLMVPVNSDSTFKFEHVRPGHYELMAIVDDDSEVGTSKWLTRKVAIDVSDSVSGIQLDLIPRK